MTATRLLARPLLASMFVVGGVNALKNATGHAQKAKPVTDRIRETLGRVAPQIPVPEDTVTLVRINGAAQLLAGLGLATGRAPRLSSTVLAASLVPTTVAGHQYWNETDPAQRINQRIHFFKNVSMLGGLLIAAVDTEGRPGVAWRAKNAVGTTRREAKHLAKEARLEAKLAARNARLNLPG